jgi:hypothetical protein
MNTTILRRRLTAIRAPRLSSIIFPVTMPINMICPLACNAGTTAEIKGTTPVVSITALTPFGAISRRAAGRSVAASLKPEVSMTCVAPKSFARLRRDCIRSTPMIVCAPRTFAAWNYQYLDGSHSYCVLKLLTYHDCRHANSTQTKHLQLSVNIVKQLLVTRIHTYNNRIFLASIHHLCHSTSTRLKATAHRSKQPQFVLVFH